MVQTRYKINKNAACMAATNGKFREKKKKKKGP